MTKHGLLIDILTIFSHSLTCGAWSAVAEEDAAEAAAGDIGQTVEGCDGRR